jgi:hypothetical protein
VRAHRIFIITAVVVASIAVATTAVASAASGRSATAFNPVVMGESLRHQLAAAHTYQFAISVDGRLEVTGERGDPNPLAAVAALRNGAPGGDAVSCHAQPGLNVEAVLLVNAGATDTQPCGLLGLAYEAARQR